MEVYEAPKGNGTRVSRRHVDPGPRGDLTSVLEAGSVRLPVLGPCWLGDFRLGFLGCRLIVRGGPECHGESRVARDTWWVPPSSLPGRFRVSNGLPRARDGTCRVAGSCLQRRETQHPGSGLVLPARFILAHGLGEPPRTVGAWLALGALGLWRQLRPAPVATWTQLETGRLFMDACGQCAINR